MTNSVKINISVGTKTYKIMCNKNIEHEFRSLASLFNEKVNEVVMSNKGLSYDNAFLIAALDFVKISQKNNSNSMSQTNLTEESLDKMNNQIEQIIKLLEANDNN